MLNFWVRKERRNRIINSSMVFEQWKGLSGSALKVIALVSMTVDHIAYYLMEHGTWTYDMMRTVGRMAFPIFAFLLV